MEEVEQTHLRDESYFWEEETLSMSYWGGGQRVVCVHTSIPRGGGKEGSTLPEQHH